MGSFRLRVIEPCSRLHRRDGTVITAGATSWFDHAVRAVAVAFLAIAFWAAVVLLQQPWRALARRLTSPGTPAPPPESRSLQDARAQADLARTLARGALEQQVVALTAPILRSEVRGRIRSDDQVALIRQRAKRPHRR